jgi:hypothetical protein
VSGVGTVAKRVGAVIVGWILVVPFLARIFRRWRRDPRAPEDLEAAYRRYPQTRDTVETPTAKTK